MSPSPLAVKASLGAGRSTILCSALAILTTTMVTACPRDHNPQKARRKAPKQSREARRDTPPPKPAPSPTPKTPKPTWQAPPPPIAPDPDVFGELVSPPAPSANPARPPRLDDHVKAAPRWYTFVDPLPTAHQADAWGQALSREVNTDAIEGRLLVCKLKRTTNKRFDSMGSAEYVLQATLGNHRPVTQNLKRMQASWPGVHLRKGQRLKLWLYDEDVFGKDSLGTAAGTFKGRFPMTLTARHYSATCTPAPQAKVQAELEALMEENRRLMEAWMLRAAAGLDKADFPNKEDNAVVTNLGKAAALVGWADPVVWSRVIWYQRVQKRHTEMVKETLTRLLTQAPPKGQWTRSTDGAYEARLLKHQCTLSVFRHKGRPLRLSDDGCRFTLEIKNLTGQPQQTHHFFDRGYPGHMALIHASGRLLKIRRSGVMMGTAVADGQPWAPQGVITVTAEIWPFIPARGAVVSKPNDFELLKLSSKDDEGQDIFMRLTQ